MQQSLRAQLLTLLGGSLVLILITALACFNLLANSLQAYHNLVDGPIEQTSQIDAANLEFKEQVQEWKNTLLRGHDSAELQRYWSRFESQERVVQATLNNLAQSVSDSALKSQIERLRSEHQNLGTQYRKALDTFRSSGADPVAGDRAVAGIDRATSEQMEALVATLHQQSTQQADQIEASAERQQWLSIVLLLAVIVVVAIGGQWLISRNLINPIRYLITHITKLSHGQFDQQVDSRRQDELGELAKAANALRDFLADTSVSLRQSTNNLDSTSGELNNIATLMAEGSREQFSRTDQVATAMHEMSATSQEVANYAANAAQAADQAEQATQHGEVAMTAMVQSINVIRSEITSTAQVITELQNDSARIGEVLEVIRGIAEQTNLLALNAAIEAARAGEQGRGFAVVADEVRSLAQRTAESTAEINQMISAVQTGALNAVRAIDNGQRSSEEGVNQVMKAGEILRGVTDAVEQMRDMNRQIATAAEEQTSVAEDISRNLTEITAIAHTNQQTVERTQSASLTLQQLSDELGQVTNRLGA